MSRRAARILLTALLLSACGTSRDTETIEIPAGAPGGSSVACGEATHPCDISTSEGEALERTIELMEEAATMLDETGLAEIIAYLRDQPDVVLAAFEDDAIVFRVDGAPETWIVDHADFATPRATPTAGAIPQPQLMPISVVGQDTTRDGMVDNRDAKRALVLAPYRWQFNEDDESAPVIAALQSTRAYRSGIDNKTNTTPDDRKVSPSDWMSFDRYDVIFVSTHTSRVCSQPGGSCKTVLSTGIEIEKADLANRADYPGFTMIGKKDQVTGLVLFELAATEVSFRMWYPNGLDDTLLVLSSCESGRAAGRSLAAAAAGDDFVMTGWTEVVDSGASLKATSSFFGSLARGLTSREAYDALVADGLNEAATDYQGEHGIPEVRMTEFEYMAFGESSVRIFEVPTLLEDGSPMAEGTDVSHRVLGIPGDGEADILRLDLSVTGVIDPSDFSVSYELDGARLPGSYRLDAKQPADDTTFMVSHDVMLGDDLAPGEHTLTSIVALPEGGESRFSVDVVVTGGACSFRLRVAETDYVGRPGDRVHYIASGTLEDHGIDIIGFSIGDVGGGSLWAADASSPAGPGEYRFAKTAITVAPGVGYWEEFNGSLTVTITAYEPKSLLVGVAEGTVVVPETEAPLSFSLEFSIVNPTLGFFSYGCEIVEPGGEP